MNKLLNEYDCYVVYHQGKYLMGKDEDGVRWTIYKYDAWRHPDRQKVARVAGKFGAHVRRFNTLTGVVGP